MFRKSMVTLAVTCGLMLGCSVLASAADTKSPAPAATSTTAPSQPTTNPSQQGLALSINVPQDGVLYNEKGDLVVSANLTNTGTLTVPALDVTVILLNDCILTNVPQTCRFAAFGTFHDVAPSGIAPGKQMQWAFDFGPYPRLDLSRWSVIWSPSVALAAPAPAAKPAPSK